MSRRKKLVLAVSCTLLLAGLLLWGMPIVYRGPSEVAPEVQISKRPAEASSVHQPNRSGLRLLTLNVAHGRGEAWHQALLSRKTIEKNLDGIASLLARVDPDLVAVQECDGPSIWSGRSSHAGRLSSKSGLLYFVHGMHVQGIQLSYGTALLSFRPLQDPLSVTFKPSPPSFCKGFVAARIDCPGQSSTSIDVVSVHLDFSRATVRRRQMLDLIEKLSGRPGPRIIMGDFNCGWSDKDSPLRELAEKSGLTAYEPDAQALQTFPGLKQRIDWILISPEFQFVKYQVMPEVLSDHLAVMAEVELRKGNLVRRNGIPPAPLVPAY